MRYLYLIRHSNSQPTGSADSRNWALTDKGRERAIALATQLPHSIDTLFTSTEPKAIVTGELLAEQLGLSVEDAIPEFDEHDRIGAPFFDDIADFEAAIADMFANPADIVFGNESAFDARGRFAGGLYEVLDETPNGNIGVITHGTVMSLVIGRFTAADPFTIWKQIQTLGMPCYAIFTLPDLAFEGLFGI